MLGVSSIVSGILKKTARSITRRIENIRHNVKTCVKISKSICYDGQVKNLLGIVKYN